MLRISPSETITAPDQRVDPTPVSSDEFLHAASVGDLAIVDAYIACNRNNATAMHVKDEASNSALHLATKNGHLAVLDALLAIDCVNVNARNFIGVTTLFSAVNIGSEIDVDKILKKPDVCLNAATEFRDTPLSTAISQGHINKDDLYLILQLTNKKYLTLVRLVRKLLEHHLLDGESFSKALKAVSFKLPSVKASTFIKEKGTEFTKVTLDSHVTFFIPRGASKRMKLCGSSGYVNKAYDVPQTNKARWAVKWIVGGTNSSKIALAKQEVKHLRHVGIQAFLYITERSIKIVMDWKDGEETFVLVSASRSKQYSFAQKLKWCISLLSCLAKSYDGFCTHRDIHVRNSIINTETNDAAFIDYESSMKLFSLSWDSRFGDSYSFAFYYLAHEDTCNNIFFNNLTTINKLAIKYLHTAMAPSELDPCSVKQARDYCQQVLENLDTLDERKLLEIADATINRKILTVDDVLHGNERAWQLSHNGL